MKRATVGMIGSIANLLGAIAPWGGMLSAIAIPMTIAALCSPLQAQVQPITQEPGTNTNINPDAGNPNQFNITGGQLSGDNQNLFHSFQQFGLDSGQIANFLANPNIRNILGRVMGGEPSIINGLIQVTVQGGSGNPNLFLMNPAGIVFGAGASLNVPASFTATTATSIGFGSNWFNAAGANNYAALVGSPTSFAFNVNQPGAIINAANLSVNGGDLTLLGGTVVNTGNVSAPGRQITVAAVEGGRLVQIKQQGMLLSLEVQPLTSAQTQPENWTLPVQSLPQLLTGGNVDSASGITLNSQGQAVLTGSGIQIDSNTGSVTVSGILDASNKTSGQAGGTVHVLANKIALVESTQVDVSGDAGGGTALIGGDYQGKGQVPNATQTFVGSNVSINADAISIGNGGKVILWADEATRFYGNISARGGNSAGNGGFVEVSGKENLAFDGSVDVGASAGTGGQLLLDPASVVIGADGTNDNQLDDGQILATDPGDVFFLSAARLLQTLQTGNVAIAATEDITIGSDIIDTSTNPNPNSLTFTAPLINLNASIALKGGNITFDGAVASTVPANRFSNSIRTTGNITFTSSLDSPNTGGLILEADGNVAILGLIGRTNPFSFLDIRQANKVELRDLPTSGLRVENVENLNIQVPGDLTLSDQNYLSATGDIQLGAQNIKISNIDIDIYDSNNRNLRTNRDLIVKARENLTIDNTSLEVGRNINLQGQSVTVQGNSNLQATGNLTVQAQGNLTLADSKLFSLGNLDLLGKGIVDIRDSATNPTIAMTGGNLTIQGDQEVNIQALTQPESVFRSTGNLNLTSNGTITGNGRFINDGNFSVLNLSGGMGNFRYNAIASNGIISSAGDVSFGNYEGVSLKVEAGGSITGGNITITEPNTALQGTDSDIAILSTDPALILRAGLTELKNTPNVLPSLTELRNSPTVPPNRTLEGTTFTSTGVSSSPGNITVGDITTSNLGSGGPVILSATGNITTGAITTGGVSVSANNKDTFGGFVTLSAGGNIQVSTINTSGSDGGDVTIVAGGLFRATGTFLSTDPGFAPNGDDITTGSDGRSTVPAGDVPTSIKATGEVAGGATISIRHGGRSFIIGPAFVRDADGDIVFVDEKRNQVSYKDTNGNIVKDSEGLVVFTDINGNQLKPYEVFPKATPFRVGDIPADASFTAGAITSNQSNIGLSVSFRDRPLIGNGTVVAGGGRISVTSSFISSNGGTDSNVGTGGRTGSGGGIGTSTGTGTNIGTNTGSTTDTGTNIGTNTGSTTDTGTNTGSTTDIGTDASSSGSVQIGTELFEHQNKQADRLSHCRTSQEQSEKTAEEEKSDRTEEEDCEEIDFFQRLNSQLTILRIELHLPADAPTQPNSSVPRSSGRN